MFPRDGATRTVVKKIYKLADAKGLELGGRLFMLEQGYNVVGQGARVRVASKRASCHEGECGV